MNPLLLKNDRLSFSVQKKQKSNLGKNPIKSFFLLTFMFLRSVEFVILWCYHLSHLRVHFKPLLTRDWHDHMAKWHPTRRIVGTQYQDTSVAAVKIIIEHEYAFPLSEMLCLRVLRNLLGLSWYNIFRVVERFLYSHSWCPFNPFFSFLNLVTYASHRS